MKVINACRILSQTTANGLRAYSAIFSKNPGEGIDPVEAEPLANVIESINKWFDVFNSRKGETGLRAPFKGLFLIN